MSIFDGISPTDMHEALLFTGKKLAQEYKMNFIQPSAPQKKLTLENILPHFKHSSESCNIAAQNLPPDVQEIYTYKWDYNRAKCYMQDKTFKDFCTNEPGMQYEERVGQTVGFCYPTKAYCESKGLDWDAGNKTCYMNDGQYVAELIFGTHVTRVWKMQGKKMVNSIGGAFSDLLDGRFDDAAVHALDFYVASLNFVTLGMFDQLSGQLGLVINKIHKSFIGKAILNSINFFTFDGKTKFAFALLPFGPVAGTVGTILFIYENRKKIEAAFAGGWKKTTKFLHEIGFINAYHEMADFFTDDVADFFTDDVADFFEDDVAGAFEDAFKAIGGLF
jgi:hypothetical protein